MAFENLRLQIRYRSQGKDTRPKVERTFIILLACSEVNFIICHRDAGTERAGRRTPSQILADQLTLSQLGGQIIPLIVHTTRPPTRFLDLPTSLICIEARHGILFRFLHPTTQNSVKRAQLHTYKS